MPATSVILTIDAEWGLPAAFSRLRWGAAELGGVVTIESLVSGGTVVALELPVGGGDGDEGAPG